jgi:hypothetical protein
VSSGSSESAISDLNDCGIGASAPHSIDVGGARFVTIPSTSRHTRLVTAKTEVRTEESVGGTV